VQTPAHLAIAWPAYSVGQGQGHGRTETALRVRTPSADASCWSNCGQTTESRRTGTSAGADDGERDVFGRLLPRKSGLRAWRDLRFRGSAAAHHHSLGH
jgi:hypothetical protein